MSCLLPQFKCQPDTFSIQFRTHHSHHSKHKEHICFRTQCVLSTTSSSTSTTATAVLDVEKLRLPSFEAHPNSVAVDRPWTYIGATGPPSEVSLLRLRASLGATLATDNLLTSDEAIIAAAAAEAVALARAAVKVAKDAALMAENYNYAKTEMKSGVSFATDSFTSKWALFTEAERAGIIGDSPTDESEMEEDDSEQNSTTESDELEPTNEELERLEEQLSRSIAVRSRRQTERKAKRTRAAEKAAANVVSVKSGSTNRKRRGALQDVDYSDPLRYLRGTTSTSRLLTANEELELSEGIQDLLKLERLQEELAERCGGQPTFAQWAAAAGVDQKTLRSRLNYGVHCKDKMIKSNIRLVISIAKNYQGAGMNLQDLVQEGCRGLVRGAEKFDASKGFKFSTYAHWWIKQAVRKSLSDQSRTIRLPFHMVEATYRVKEARKQLYSENGRHPDNEEVAEATGLSMKRLTAVLLTPKAPRSLDQKIGINQNLKPSEVIADPEAETAEDMLIKQFMRKDLEKVLDSLSQRERQVIRWRFGMEDGRMKTLQEIGELMGVSRERIRQIESCAFRKLKNKKRTKHLQQYLLSYAS
ncbi:PREDICTED: RNA polymerase sigma factor sigB isoform X1 [Theobroma cacao]|uniref:RNA polymerase sigma factor n=1 Tax=Theobroma cacao TaxID=3641 RepID=A0AB32WIC4_THECC|nr:PREDICTED: RNA polymerase sigma factor sigB isoform X1 [Theobroma cacao]